MQGNVTGFRAVGKQKNRTKCEKSYRISVTATSEVVQNVMEFFRVQNINMCTNPGITS